MSASRLLEPAPRPQVGPLLRMSLQLSDRPLVTAGERVGPGQPMAHRYRDQHLVEVATDAALLAVAPGQPVDQPLHSRTGRGGQGQIRPGERARVIAHTRDGRTLLAVGRGDTALASPVTGTVQNVLPSRIDLRAEGLGLAGLVAWGRPVGGRLVMGVASPDAELRASAIDVAAAGAILVAGARLDIEALTRARAIGVAGVVCGGIVGRELRQIEISEMRQRAALHPAAPFALLALGGYGRRPIPAPVWELLSGVEGRAAGISVDDRLLLLEGDEFDLATRPFSADAVLVAGGDHCGAEARLLGLAGPRRWPGGIYAPGAFVELASPGGLVERACLPASDLQRLG